MTGTPPGNAALPVMPEAARLPQGIVECFYGEHDEDTLRPALASKGIEVVRMQGAHHSAADRVDLRNVSCRRGTSGFRCMIQALPCLYRRLHGSALERLARFAQT